MNLQTRIEATISAPIKREKTSFVLVSWMGGCAYLPAPNFRYEPNALYLLTVDLYATVVNGRTFFRIGQIVAMDVIG